MSSTTGWRINTVLIASNLVKWPAGNSRCPQDLSGEQLEAAILAAHDDEDADRLARLYERAADLREQHGDIAEACFFLTQALVFALVCGSPREARIRARLHAHGREEL